LDDARENGDITEDEHEAIVAFLNKCDRDISRTSLTGEKDKAPSTLREYCKRLRLVSRRLDADLTEASDEDINLLWDRMATGEHEDVREGGVSTNTINAYQSAVRKFVEHGECHDYEKEAITMVTPEKSQVDTRELFEPEDIDAMRDAVDHPRNRAILDLLIWTGQRIRAVQTLRIKDVDLDQGVFWLNDDAEGLKGADGKRPLLGAEAAMRDWINKYHPAPNDPDAYVMCHRNDSSGKAGGHRPISRKAISRILKDIADRAGVDKPVNPHQFRHYFVTIAKTKYGLDDMTVKGLIGHRLDSRIMEETYAHLQDEDHIREAQKQMGNREPEEQEDPLSPDLCPNCDEPLAQGAKACPSCGVTFTPDARSAKDTVKETTHEGALAAEDEEEKAAVDAVKSMLDENPELAVTLAEELSDQ
jgi:integrase/recombinase XerD